VKTKVTLTKQITSVRVLFVLTVSGNTGQDDSGHAELTAPPNPGPHCSPQPAAGLHGEEKRPANGVSSTIVRRVGRQMACRGTSPPAKLMVANQQHYASRNIRLALNMFHSASDNANPGKSVLLLIEMSDSHLPDCVGLTLGIVEKVATGNGVESTQDILDLIAIWRSSKCGPNRHGAGGNR